MIKISLKSRATMISQLVKSQKRNMTTIFIIIFLLFLVVFECLHCFLQLVKCEYFLFL